MNLILVSYRNWIVGGIHQNHRQDYQDHPAGGAGGPGSGSGGPGGGSGGPVEVVLQLLLLQLLLLQLQTAQNRVRTPWIWTRIRQ